ncbi:uncharacterized protein ARMOST_14372 [Armillaria ostoyae]|uniref:Uncharacterized protein n=1 Tax=Armillaria ostoyae TaxID=47428 RepID=A0A284RQC5_ARMOS|nr:uncharacterized protein ARMOST_14372 [Armillaria ostoyae]
MQTATGRTSWLYHDMRTFSTKDQILQIDKFLPNLLISRCLGIELCGRAFQLGRYSAWDLRRNSWRLFDIIVKSDMTGGALLGNYRTRFRLDEQPPPFPSKRLKAATTVSAGRCTWAQTYEAAKCASFTGGSICLPTAMFGTTTHVEPQYSARVASERQSPSYVSFKIMSAFVSSRGSSVDVELGPMFFENHAMYIDAYADTLFR